MPRKLKQTHEELFAAMERMKAIGDGGAIDLADVLRERFAFSRVFRRYLEEEQAVLRRLPDTPQHRAAMTEMQDLLHDYSGHVTTWTPDAIKADQTGYLIAAQAIKVRLLHRIDWERRELVPQVGAVPAA